MVMISRNSNHRGLKNTENRTASPFCDNSLIRTLVGCLIGMKSLDGVRCIIFDLDDTLYLSDVWVTDLSTQWFEEVGLFELKDVSRDELELAYQDARRWVNTYAMENNVGPKWMPTHEQWVEYNRIVLRLLGVKRETDRFAEEITRKWEESVVPWESSIIPGCKEVLEELHSRGYKLGLATNRWEDPSGLLKRDSVLELFDAVEYSLVPGYKKPSPYMLFKIASKVNINPRRCVFVGDNLEKDVEAARRAQIIPILLTWDKRGEVGDLPPNLVIVDEIQRLLDLFL